MWARASLEGHSVDACAEHLGAGMVEAGMAAACPVHLLCLAAEGDRLAPERALASMLQRDFGTLSSRSASAHPDPKKPGDPKHFRLDERSLKEYESRPPVFQHLSTNAYGDLPVPRAEPGGGCSCLPRGWRRRASSASNPAR